MRLSNRPKHSPTISSRLGEPLDPPAKPKAGDPCPAGCAASVPPYTPDMLRENEGGEVSCPSCWEVFE